MLVIASCATQHKNALLGAKEDDFIYLDPPYQPSSATANFTDYSDHGFDDNDQVELSKIFAELNDRKCKVLLSNSDTPLIRKL